MRAAVPTPFFNRSRRSSSSFSVMPFTSLVDDFEDDRWRLIPADEQAAINDHDLARHVAGGRGCQEQDDIGDVLGLADAPHRNEGGSSLRSFRAERVLFRK